MKRPIDLIELAVLTFAATLVALVIGAGIVAPRLPPLPQPPVVEDGPVEPILRRDTWCPPPELREPEPTLDLSTEDCMSAIETETKSFAALVRAMRLAQRGHTRAEVDVAVRLELQVDARVREILGEPAVLDASGDGGKEEHF
jgi:hypothetical protein